ncbi:MAG: hypothetical protein LBS84_11635, partial [Clostridiales bacterium]|nr:hypothetical protein [Clostridiales bacterium]
MAKPLNEINTEFEITRNKVDDTSIRMPQERYTEMWKPDPGRFTLPGPDRTGSRYSPPLPDVIKPRFQLPEPDPVIPKYTPPDLVMPKYTLPPEPEISKYTPPASIMPKYTPPDPLIQKYTSPDPVIPKYTTPDSVMPRYTPPPDLMIPTYTPLRLDPEVPGYTPRQFEPSTEDSARPWLRQTPEPLASLNFEPVRPKFSQISISDYTPAPVNTYREPPPPSEPEIQPINVDIGERLRKAAARRQGEPVSEDGEAPIIVTPSLPKTAKPKRDQQPRKVQKAKTHHAKARGKENNSAKNTIADVLFYSVLVALVIGALYWGKDSGKPINIFGYSAMNVLSTSMQDTIPKGSLIITSQV